MGHGKRRPEQSVNPLASGVKWATSHLLQILYPNKLGEVRLGRLPQMEEWPIWWPVTSRFLHHRDDCPYQFWQKTTKVAPQTCHCCKAHRNTGELQLSCLLQGSVVSPSHSKASCWLYGAISWLSRADTVCTEHSVSFHCLPGRSRPHPVLVRITCTVRAASASHFPITCTPGWGLTGDTGSGVVMKLQ